MEGANSVVAVYLEHLDRIRAEAADQGIPHWELASLRLASSAGGAEALVITAYLLGSAVVISMIPRTWWSAPIEVAKEARSMLLLMAVGAIGFAVFASSDLAGYGYPGFGAIQFVGSVLSFAAVAFGVVGLSNHRREDEPAPPKLPGIPPAAK